MPAESALRDGVGPGLGLIETLRWQPGNGFVRLDRHLARLGASARALGLDFDPHRIVPALEDTVGESANALRVRLLLSRNGHAEVSAHPYEPLPEGRTWTLRLARRTRLSSSDPLLRHKTSRRDAYVRARAEYGPAEADEVLLANERGELCEGTITTLFADFGDGVLATPPLECGLLAGVLRAEMLEEGRAREAVFGPQELKSAAAVFVGNSLRGLIPARLA